MNKITTVSDEELWKSASLGDADSEEMLVKRYSSLVRVCSRPFFLVGGDNEDLIQEGMMGLLSAVRHFDPARDTKFRTYAEQCIKNRLITAVKTATRFKHSPLNESLSIESPHFDECRAAKVPCSLRDPEELVITRELTDEMTRILGNSLSEFEKSVLGYFLEGMSYADIALRVARSAKSVDNAVQRIRRKLARFL